MLKGIDPLLNAQLLQVLRAMGHGDELIVADANFPSDSVARATVTGTLLRLDADAPRAMRAILSVLPLDTFVDHPASRMEIVGEPLRLPPVQQQVQREIDAAEGRACPMAGIERHAFYARARKAYAVVQTAEQRGYGCFVLTKGVILADEAASGAPA